MNSELTHQIVSKLKQLYPQGADLHAPQIKQEDFDGVMECLKSTFVSSFGPYTEKFEKRLSQFTKIPHVVAVSNGTSALHLCLRICGVQAGEEVLMPALTFAATANAALLHGCSPHFVDVEENTFGIDPQKLKNYLEKITVIKNSEAYNKNTLKKISALIVVHLYGFAAKACEIKKICDEFHIKLIEDTAESLGTFDQGEHVGSFGLCSAMSFNGNKIVTTGGGGAVMTHSQELATLAKHLSTTAKIGKAWEYFHDQHAYNYRLPNLNASLGLAQMEKIEIYLQQKQDLQKFYSKFFYDLKGAQVISAPKEQSSNYWLIQLKLNTPSLEQRDSIIEQCNAEQIRVRPCWTSLHKLPFLKDYPRDILECTEKLEKSLISLPSSPFLVSVIR